MHSIEQYTLQLRIFLIKAIFKSTVNMSQGLSVVNSSQNLLTQQFLLAHDGILSPHLLTASLQLSSSVENKCLMISMDLKGGKVLPGNACVLSTF